MSSITQIQNQSTQRKITRNNNNNTTTTTTNVTKYNSITTANNSITQNTSRRFSLEKTIQNSNSNEGVYRNARFCNINLILVGCPVILKVKSGDIFHGVFATFSPDFEVVLECCHKIDTKNDVQIYGRSIPNKNDINTLVFSRDDIVEITATDIDKDYAIKSAESNFIDAAIAQKTNGPQKEVELVKELEPFAFEESHEDDFELNTQSNKTDTFELELESTNGWSADDMLLINQTKYGYKSTYNSELTEYTIPVEKEDSEDYRRREEEAEKIAREIESSSTYRENVDKELSDNEEEEQAFSAVERANDNNNNNINKDTHSQQHQHQHNNHHHHSHHHQQNQQSTNRHLNDYNKTQNYENRYSNSNNNNNNNRRSMPDRGRPSHMTRGGGTNTMSASNSFSKRNNFSSFHQQNRSFERQGSNSDLSQTGQNRNQGGNITSQNASNYQKRPLNKQNSEHLNTSSLNNSNLSNASTSSNPSVTINNNKKYQPTQVSNNIPAKSMAPHQQQQSPSYLNITANNSTIDSNEISSSIQQDSNQQQSSGPISYSKVAASKLDQQAKQVSVKQGQNSPAPTKSSSTLTSPAANNETQSKTPPSQPQQQQPQTESVDTSSDDKKQEEKTSSKQEKESSDLASKVSKLNPFAQEFNPSLSQVTSPNSVSSHQSVTPVAFYGASQVPVPQTVNQPLIHGPPPLLTHTPQIIHHPQTQMVLNQNGQPTTSFYIPIPNNQHTQQGAFIPPQHQQQPPLPPNTPSQQQQQQQSQQQQTKLIKKAVVSINDNSSAASITVNNRQQTSTTGAYINHTMTYPPAAPGTPNNGGQQIIYYAPGQVPMRMYQPGPYLAYAQGPPTHGVPDQNAYINQSGVYFAPQMIQSVQQNPANQPPNGSQNVNYAPTSSTPSSIVGPSAPHTPSPMPSQQQQSQPQQSTSTAQQQQATNMNLQINPQQPQPPHQQFYYVQSPVSNPGMPTGMPYAALTIPYGHPSQLCHNGQYLVYNQPHHQMSSYGMPQVHQQAPPTAHQQNRMYYVPQNSNQSYSH